MINPQPAAAKNSAAPQKRPPARLLHHMARSGGTIISKCLGCMNGVVLLSEINPAGVDHFGLNPLRQAHEWFQLLTSADLEALRRGTRIPFVQAIRLIDARTRQSGKTLVIRDWSHVDFTGVPVVETPSYELTLARTLATNFEVIQTASVRHPIDQWLGLRRVKVVQGRLALEDFLRGYRHFAERASAIGFIRYEDFTADPDAVLRLLCDRLQIRFDAEYRHRWRDYTKISGDLGTGKDESDKLAHIRRPDRRPSEPGLIDRFAHNDDYRRAIALLGYHHPA